MQLADARLSPIDEADLRWLLCESEGDLGARSALGGQLDRLQEGRVSASQLVDAHEAALRQVSNVDRARRIERVLRSLESRHRKTLRAAFGPPLPVAGNEGLAGLTTTTLPLALMRLTAHRQHIKVDTLRGWLRTPVLPELPEDATAERRAEAQATHDKAMKAWREVSRKGIADLRQEATVALVVASHAYADAARSQPKREGRQVRIG